MTTLPSEASVWNISKSVISLVLLTVWTISTAGATPKLIASHRLSSWAPKSVAWRVIRATRPSSTSKNMAANSSHAATAR